MKRDSKTKEEIIEQAIMGNARRQSRYIDQVQMLDGVPLFSWVDLSVTELCNRKCAFCPRNDPTQYPNQDLNMDIDLCRKIADELRTYQYKGGVVFSSYGEPLLHKKIVELIDIFGTDIHTEIVTNGDKLSEVLIHKLFEAGLSTIIVSMYDGPHQVDYFRKMFEKAGLRQEQYFLRDRWYNIDKDFGLLLTNRGGVVKRGNQRHVDEKRPCYYTSYFLLIDWNGDVVLCPQDWNKKIKFGNVHSQTLLEVWKSRSLTKYRKALVEGKRMLFPCDRCNVLGTVHGYNHAEIWNKLYEGAECPLSS